MEQLSSPRFLWVHVARSLVFCVMFCRSQVVLLSFVFCPLYHLSLDLPFFITHLVSFNRSCKLCLKMKIFFKNKPFCKFLVLMYLFYILNVCQNNICIHLYKRDMHIHGICKSTINLYLKQLLICPHISQFFIQ